ncbi:MAG: hypothetical protein KGL39_48085 [Patescibacteria group bacterium]|nr:hypothetical protein [Patescibacteria group bacterium]
MNRPEWPRCFEPGPRHREDAPLGCHEYWPDLRVGDQVTFLWRGKKYVHATVAALDLPGCERVFVWIDGVEYTPEHNADVVNRHNVRRLTRVADAA